MKLFIYLKISSKGVYWFDLLLEQFCRSYCGPHKLSIVRCETNWIPSKRCHGKHFILKLFYFLCLIKMKWSFTSVSIAFHAIYVEMNLKLHTNACEFHFNIQLLYFVLTGKLFCNFQKQKFNSAEEMHKKILFFFKFFNFIYFVSIRMKHGLFWFHKKLICPSKMN